MSEEQTENKTKNLLLTNQCKEMLHLRSLYGLINDSIYLGLSPQLKSLSLPDCWIKDFFVAHMYTELQMIKEALQKYQNLIDAGFSKSTYIISQIAVAYHNIRSLFSTFFKNLLSEIECYGDRLLLTVLLS